MHIINLNWQTFIRKGGGKELFTNILNIDISEIYFTYYFRLCGCKFPSKFYFVRLQNSTIVNFKISLNIFLIDPMFRKQPLGLCNFTIDT